MPKLETHTFRLVYSVDGEEVDFVETTQPKMTAGTFSEMVRTLRNAVGGDLAYVRRNDDADKGGETKGEAAPAPPSMPQRGPTK